MEQVFYEIRVWLEASGNWAYLLAPLIMAAVAVLPIPAEIPAMLNGALFGPLVGTLITYSGALMGAQASFELARRLGRPVAERLISPSVLQKADGYVLRAGLWGLLLPRFVPLIAFTALNWGAGLTPVSRWRFFWTTAIGIIPGTVLFTVTGSGLPIAVRRFPYVVGFLATALLLYCVLRVCRGARHE